MKKKIVIFGDDPTGYTGFGKINGHLVDAVVEAGHIPVVVALKVNHDKDYRKAEIYNAIELGDVKGWKTLAKVVKEQQASMIISIGDPWDIMGIVEIRQANPVLWLGYVPVDSTPYPRYVLLNQSPQQYLDVAFVLGHMDQIVTYSHFGARAVKTMLEKVFFPCSGSKGAMPEIPCISLGVESSIYCPKDRKEARRVFSGSVSVEHLLFGCIKVNSMRAGFDTLLHAWALYQKKARDIDEVLAQKSKLYLHTNLDNGYPVDFIIKRHGLEQSVILNPLIKAGSGLTQAAMVDIVNSFDISVSAVRGEGFGLNILEAMSCEVPSIVPDYGCPAEYGANAVMRIPIAATYNPEFATTDFAIVDAEKMAQAMLELGQDSIKQKEMGKEGRKIAECFSWQKFRQKWIEKIESSFCEAT